MTVMIADMIKPIELMKMTPEEAEDIWQKVRVLDECFDDLSRDNPKMFAARLFSPSTSAYTYKDSGLVMIENIIPRLSGAIHFFVWNKTLTDSEMTEVGREVIRQVIDTYKVHRIYATPPAFNKLARRLAFTLGFHYEGSCREAMLFKGKYIDIDLYGLLTSRFGKVIQ